MTKFGKFLISAVVFVVIVFILYLAQRQAPTVVAPVVEEKHNTNNVLETSVSDLITFSIVPNSKLNGKISFNGEIKGGYFFEANILINILDSDKKLLKAGHATATTEWMTAGPVKFEGEIDLTGLTKGSAFLEIHNDNASGLPENDKSILIPIIIE